MDSDPLGLDTHVSDQLVLSAGLAVGVFDGEVDQSHPIVGTLSQQFDSDWQPGLAMAIAWQRTSWNGDGDGWHFELGLNAERWGGQITKDTIGGVANTADAGIAVEAVGVTMAAGPTWRWDGDELRVAPRLWQLDVAPVIGLGTAHVQVADGDWSERGLMVSFGARVRLTVALGAGWRVGGQLGAAWSQTTVRWSNTLDSTFSAFGPTAGLVLVLGE